MWDLNESPDQEVVRDNESEDVSDKGKRVGTGGGSASASASVSNSSSSAAAAPVNSWELASEDEEEVEAEEDEDEDAADPTAARKRSSGVFGFPVPYDDCPRPTTLQFFPEDGGDRAEEEAVASAAASSSVAGAFPRAHWAGVRFCHSNQAAPLPSLDVSQPMKKSRRGPRSRSSQYRGVTFYRRTGRWESHIWSVPRVIKFLNQAPIP